MLWACVPLGGKPSTCEMPTFELKSAPPISAARAPAFTPSAWPRRMPNSSTVPPRPLARMRAIVGIVSKEVIELRRGIVQAHAKVYLGHGQLVFVGIENTFRGGLILNAHSFWLPQAPGRS